MTALKDQQRQVISLVHFNEINQSSQFSASASINFPMYVLKLRCGNLQIIHSFINNLFLVRTTYLLYSLKIPFLQEITNPYKKQQ